MRDPRAPSRNTLSPVTRSPSSSTRGARPVRSKTPRSAGRSAARTRRGSRPLRRSDASARKVRPPSMSSQAVIPRASRDRQAASTASRSSSSVIAPCAAPPAAKTASSRSRPVGAPAPSRSKEGGTRRGPSPSIPRSAIPSTDTRAVWKSWEKRSTGRPPARSARSAASGSRPRESASRLHPAPSTHGWWGWAAAWAATAERSASSPRPWRSTRDACLPRGSRWRWASRKAGRISSSPLSSIRAPGPARARISSRPPTATTRPPAQATPSARGRDGSAVSTVPRMTRSTSGRGSTRGA